MLMLSDVPNQRLTPWHFKRNTDTSYEAREVKKKKSL